MAKKIKIELKKPTRTKEPKVGDVFACGTHVFSEHYFAVIGVIPSNHFAGTIGNRPFMCAKVNRYGTFCGISTRSKLDLSERMRCGKLSGYSQLEFNVC